jgi:hypothetical protein
MFSRSYDIEEAVERIMACSAIGFTEQFEGFLHNISGRLDLPLAAKQERRFKFTVNPSPAELNRAREMLDPEYKLVGKIKDHTAGAHA